MGKKELKKLLKERQGYLKSGTPKLSILFGVTREEAKQAVKEVKKELATTDNGKPSHIETALWKEFTQWKKKKVKKSKTKFKGRGKLPKPFLGGDIGNVLIVGDIHEPFCLKEYLFFCREVQELHNCGTVVFIGDLVDNHFSSYHESELEAYGPNEEFDLAAAKIAEWYKVFPEAYVTIGNHDRLVHRKCKTAGLSDRWLKSYGEALKTPNWEYIDSVDLYGVNYNHGEGGTAKTRMKNEFQSQVQGHLHNQAYVDFSVGSRHIIFGMQVGCGIDGKAYAFSYGKNYKKSFIGCGVVKNKGTLPLILPMNLETKYSSKT